jgi:hypothetical protein
MWFIVILSEEFICCLFKSILGVCCTTNTGGCTLNVVVQPLKSILYTTSKKIKERLKRRGLLIDTEAEWEVHDPHPDMPTKFSLATPTLNSKKMQNAYALLMVFIWQIAQFMDGCVSQSTREQFTRSRTHHIGGKLEKKIEFL